MFSLLASSLVARNRVVAFFLFMPFLVIYVRLNYEVVMQVAIWDHNKQDDRPPPAYFPPCNFAKAPF